MSWQKTGQPSPMLMAGDTLGLALGGTVTSAPPGQLQKPCADTLDKWAHPSGTSSTCYCPRAHLRMTAPGEEKSATLLVLAWLAAVVWMSIT